jgi:ATP-dependent Clp protease adaptor protein ClpS
MHAAARFIRMAVAVAADPDEAVPGLATPPLHAVWVLHNRFTPAPVVAQVLVRAFHLTEAQALAIIARSHRDARALVGTYTRDIATTLARRACDTARTLGDDELVFLVRPA